MNTLFVPGSRVRTEIEVKKSRFICTLDPVEDGAQGKQRLHQIRSEYPQANHHCWAIQTGPATSLFQACSDDGEPHGTAGKPMLNQLIHSGLTNVQVVVSRLFGGVKLGTGGLVRAYSDAVATALVEVVSAPFIIWQTVRMHYAYEYDAMVRQLIEQAGVHVTRQDFTEQVCLLCRCPQQQTNQLKNKLMGICSGNIRFNLVD